MLWELKGPLLINDLAADNTFNWLAAQARQLLAVPLQRQDQVLGCLFALDKQDGEFDRTQFWKHSIGCGCAAKAIGRRLNYPMLEELFIAGLLHDVGKIVMDQYMPEKFVEVLDVVHKRDCLIAEAENEVLGATHADVGAWLFEKWNLSKGLIETTRCHHNPALAGEHTKLAEIIHLADILIRAMRFGNGGDNKIPVVSDSAWKSLGLQHSDFDDLLVQTNAEIDKAMVFLDFINK